MALTIRTFALPALAALAVGLIATPTGAQEKPPAVDQPAVVGDKPAAAAPEGKPIDLVFPKEGLGWELEASGIYKGTKKMDAAKKLMDWSISDAAMALYAKNFAVVAVPSLSVKITFTGTVRLFTGVPESR